jgi:uncharacterized repeat protein (TIGR03803 family)
MKASLRLPCPIPNKLFLAANLVFAVLVLTVLSAQAASYKKLYSFKGGSDGEAPFAGVIRDAKGNLYGTTFDGGGTYGSGIVYKLSLAGKETILHVFQGPKDDGFPYDSLLRDMRGNLYGTVHLGGVHGYGAVFKISPSGKESILYSFRGKRDGAYPQSNLIQDAAGNFYGTTFDGGSNNCYLGPLNCGVVFKLSPDGKETVLHAFTGTDDGARPNAGLIMDSAGNLYGTTTRGGPTDGGTVFRIDTNGVETVLHAFVGSTDGWDLEAGLTMDSDGNLYGTTTWGGSGKLGVAFKLDLSGNETVLHNFSGGADGENPMAGMVFDSSGNLYGTTFAGGPQDHGTIFKIDPTGQETILYTFTKKLGGTRSKATLIMDANGNLYGTTQNGGDFNDGTVFRFTP